MKKIALSLIILIGIGLVIVFMDNSKKEENIQPIPTEQNTQVAPKEEINKPIEPAQTIQEPQKEETKTVQENQTVPTPPVEERKPKTKVEKLKELSSKGDAKAQNQLGDIYANGSNGVKQSYKEALTLFQSSAKSGNADAQYNLGTMYQNAIGVDQDLKKAVKYYKLAQKKGHKGAKQSLDMLCNEDPSLCK